MTLRLGTRTLQGFRKEHPATGSIRSRFTRDVGMSKYVTPATVTFTNSDGRITGANGDFAAFAIGDPIVIEASIGGTASNDGERVVTDIDATNHAYLVLDPPPKNGGPTAGVIVRTP